MPIPAAAVIELTDEERAALERWARLPSSAQALALRSRIVLFAAEGRTNTEIAKRLGISRPTVTKWRGRFARAAAGRAADPPGGRRPPAAADGRWDRRPAPGVAQTSRCSW